MTTDHISTQDLQRRRSEIQLSTTWSAGSVQQGRGENLVRRRTRKDLRVGQAEVRHEVTISGLTPPEPVRCCVLKLGLHRQSKRKIISS